MSLMTKEEYKIFKAKGELMGKLEQERRAQQVSHPDYPANFLPFLDEMYSLWLGDNEMPVLSERKLQGKILLRQLLNKLPKGAFEKI